MRHNLSKAETVKTGILMMTVQYDIGALTNDIAICLQLQQRYSITSPDHLPHSYSMHSDEKIREVEI